MTLAEDTEKASVAQKQSYQRVRRAWSAVVRIQALKERVDLGHIAKIETSSRVIGASVAVVQRNFEHVHRVASAVAGSELGADKPQDYMADGFRTLMEACYMVVEGTVHLGQMDTAHLVMGAKNMSA